MRYNKEVVEARKFFDDLVIEQREGKKQLEAVRAEIRAKLDGKPSPHKFEELKKQEAQLEARLGDLPVLIADARDALIVALNEQARGLAAITPKELETSMDKILKPCEKLTAAMDELKAAIVKEAERLSEITGEKISIDMEDLLKRACENYLTDRGAGFKVRLLSRITQRLSDGMNTARYLLTNETERLRPKKSIWA